MIIDKELEERLDLIEFRQDLLFENTAFSRLMYSNDITRNQRDALIDLFVEYNDAVEAGKTVSSSNYEVRVGEIVPHRNHMYHFAEEVAKFLHEEGKFQEVFEALYGDKSKYQSYLEDYR